MYLPSRSSKQELDAFWNRLRLILSSHSSTLQGSASNDVINNIKVQGHPAFFIQYFKITTLMLFNIMGLSEEIVIAAVIIYAFMTK